MCDFKQITKEEIKNSVSYIATNVILSKKTDFTPLDILNDIKKENQILEDTVNVDFINNLIRSLQNNGVIYEQYSRFSVRRF